MKRLSKSKYLLVAILALATFLRLYKLSEVPVSLFGDELDVGYHAYSILKTGKDYMGNPWPLHFQSLAEYRTPLYLYSSVPSVAIFGISAWGVRLPAAIFGIAGVLSLYLLVEILTNKKTALVAALVLAISPWHIQYSRAAFEVTELLFFLTMGLYFFFKAVGINKKLGEQKYLRLSSLFIGITPWIYNSAKFFSFFLIIFLVLLYFKKLRSFKKKHLAYAVIALLIVGLPMAYEIFIGGGAQRFNYLSVFADPTTESEVGTLRLQAARMRGELGEGLSPTLWDRLVYNKFTYWGGNILKNVYSSLSTQFLFVHGDPILRHSIEGMGQFYKIDFVAILFGIVAFFGFYKNRKVKLLVVFMILLTSITAGITMEGGNHATRLITFLVPFTILISYGITNGFKLLKKPFPALMTLMYAGLLVAGFIFYQQKYWVHNPWYSERWWHAGWGEAIHSMKDVEDNYDKIIISTAHEPPWTFFAAHYEYPPEKWQTMHPFDNDVEVQGFGKIGHTGKFYFGSPPKNYDFYDWGEIIASDTLYLADEREVGINLIKEPGRMPENLQLVKAIPFPSGEPAFYLFSGKDVVK